MLDRIIAFSLRNRPMVLAVTVVVAVLGSWVVAGLPVDVFPDLNRPTVTIMTEAPGLAPEEVEALVTFPIESAVIGATGVQRVRSASGVGLSIVWVEFDWGSDIYTDRQLVAEKLQLAERRLPQGATPVLAPISSIMGEIMLLGVQSADGATSPLELRTLADWVIRPRLLSLSGVSQVTVMGGGLKQYQVITSPARLAQYGVSLSQLVEAVRGSSLNTGGGFLQRPDEEFLIRIMGRAEDIEDLSDSVVLFRSPNPVLVRHVADVRLGAPVKRGDGSLNGEPAVILSIQKQPGADTLSLTAQLDQAVQGLQATLPADVRLDAEAFRQETFIRAAIRNVEEAIRDGVILVVIVLFLFLWNLRTSAVSLIAIPMSVIMTGLVFKWWGIGINTMTLGGLAVAIGEVVDDSIVDIENIFRRLRENRALPLPRPVLRVVFEASREVRNSIVYATAILVLVCLPLFALGGLEGRMFAPLGMAYVLTLISSLVVSLTVTPALASYVLPWARSLEAPRDPFLLRWLKAIDRVALRFTVRQGVAVLMVSLGLVVGAGYVMSRMGGEFLPPFQEGTYTINIISPPGTSLAESNRIGSIAERRLLSIPEVASTARRTGRAELDEHAEGVNYSEIEARLREGAPPEVIDAIRKKLVTIPGVTINVGQPISHRLDHILSGIRAQIAVKVFGSDLPQLRDLAQDVQGVMAGVEGVTDLRVEPQVEVPQVQVKIRRAEVARYGLRVEDVAEALEVAFQGRAVAEILRQQQTFDIVVWYDEESRSRTDVIRTTLIDTPAGERVSLGKLADIVVTDGPNTINRENAVRRIVVSCNTTGRDLVSVVEDIRGRVDGLVGPKLPAGYYVAYGGQFESQQQASRQILILSLFSFVGIFLLLQRALQSWRAALQCLINIPLAMVGGVAALYLTGESLSIASLVGFITLAGIATRNGIMMISHYIHLMRYEGELFDEAMIIRGSLERLAPVLMTALTTIVGLVPLALGAGETGKEILHPMAVVIVGGLVSSTLLDQLVTPALFFRFGRSEWERKIATGFSELDDPGDIGGASEDVVGVP